MRTHNKHSFLLAVSVSFCLLACQVLSFAPEVTSSPAPLSTAVIPVTASPVLLARTAVPHDTPIPVAAGEQIQVDYTYTDNLVTSLYHLYGNVLDNFVDISLTNPSSDPVRVIIHSEVTGYTNPAIDTVDVDAGATLEVHQNPRLLVEAVDQLNSQKPADFHIRVVYLDQGQERTVLDETRSILIYSRRDFVWIPGFETNEEYQLWAAWVTPTDPAVEELVRRAADYYPGGAISYGYGGVVNDDDGSVWNRLEAIWQAEKDYHLTYVSTMLAFGPGAVQRIRLPAEVLSQSGGNCVELAALFASAAEAMGLETAIIRIPGHAYTAVRKDQENAIYYFVETTMIADADFQRAVEVASSEWEDAFPHLDANEEGYAWVTIQDARTNGILPIPWR
jgi:hypothetical protein